MATIRGYTGIFDKKEALRATAANCILLKGHKGRVINPRPCVQSVHLNIFKKVVSSANIFSNRLDRIIGCFGFCLANERNWPEVLCTAN